MPSAHQAVAVDGRVGQLLADEAALGAGRHDDGVLDDLRLDEPSTSVRKSSRRSDHRSPPRATAPKRRCTPSTRGL
jgi:hypothetical protein